MTYLRKTNDVLVSLLRIIFVVLCGVLLGVLLVGLVKYGFVEKTFLIVVDKYLTIVLTSWPAAILILCTILFWFQKDSIDYFIRKRMTGVGFDGVTAAVDTGDADAIEIKGKEVADAEEENELNDKEVSPIRIEHGVIKPGPNTIRKEVFERYTENVRIEELAQQKLKLEYQDAYQSHVKLSTPGGQSIILDGLLTTYTGSKRAVEIKFLREKEKHISLKYVLYKLKEKIGFFGIKKLIVVIIAKNLTKDDAVQIRESLKFNVSLRFFNLTDDESVVEIIPFPKE